jgi:hypothetical protein|tara:strand:- start:941 stop:1243 length:303 start_codon:yes stop_codon:yes gene_type:complete
MSNRTHGGKGDRQRVIQDRTTYDSNYDAIFTDTVALNYTEEGASLLADVELLVDKRAREKEDVQRKLREWNMMYDCLQNIHLYDYPVQEVKELLKQIKVS